MIFSGKRQTVTIIVKNSITVRIAPRVFVNQSITIVIDANGTVVVSKHFKEHHWNLVGHPFTSVEITNHLDIRYVFVVSTVADEIIALSAIDSFEIFATTGDFHPWRWMAVVVTLVTVSGHLNTTCIDTTVQSFMERHDVDILPLIGIGLFCELKHTLPHAVIIVVLLELSTIIAAPWVDMICIIIAPNTLRSVTGFVFFERCCHG